MGTWQNGSQSNSAWLSPRADCPKQDLLNEWGKPIYQIVEEFADDHDVWAKAFLEAWPRMQDTGYAAADLTEGSQNSWIGYYNLLDMGTEIGNDYESFITTNKPVVFTTE